MENGMNLSGQLGDWPVDDLIQIVQVTKKTGSLDISGDRRGRIHFREGLLTGAELHSAQGVYAGADADTIADVIFVLGRLESGTFAMGASEGPESEGHPAEEITASVAELRALETEISDAGVMDGDIRLVDTVDAKITLDPSSWHYLARLIPVLTIDELEERFGRGSAVRTMHALNNLGLLAPTAVPSEEADNPETADESGWLEKLADDVSTSAPGDWDSAVDVEIEIKESQRQPVEAGTIRSVAADASTTLTGGVYDDIRRLRSKAAE
jgi:hypothetical protein